MPGPNPDPPPDDYEPELPEIDREVMEEKVAEMRKRLTELEGEVHDHEGFRQIWQEGWTPTREQPTPEQNGPYLVTLHCPESFSNNLQVTELIYDSGWVEPNTLDTFSSRNWYVIAWRRLPPPYQPTTD